MFQCLAPAEPTHRHKNSHDANGKYLITGKLLCVSVVRRLLERAAGMQAYRKANDAFRASKSLGTV